MTKAVILDGYTLNPGDLDWAPLERLADFKIYDRTTFHADEAALIIERAKDAEVILTNKKRKRFLPNSRSLNILGFLRQDLMSWTWKRQEKETLR